MLGASVEVSLPPLRIQTLEITLIGDSPLICHAWSPAAKEAMLAKQTGAAKQKKARKDPERDFLESLYKMPGGGYGFPSVGFKAAAVSACRAVEGIKMTEARGAFQIPGELVRIDGVPTRREDMVRVGMGTADIRYRGEFREWSVVLPIRLNTAALSVAQVVNLFSNAGFGVGVGEWRPERGGPFGTFHVAEGE